MATKKTESNSQNFYMAIIISSVLALGISIAGYFISNTLYKANADINIAQVRGLSEKQVTADYASWKVSFRVSETGNVNSAELYKDAETKQQKIIQLLKKVGFSDSDINFDPFNYYFNSNRNKNNIVVDETHTINASVTVQTEDVDLVKVAQSEVNKLIGQGIMIQNTAPIYRFTSLNKIKPDMLKEATKNARIAATEFAKNAGAKVGSIKSARQGNFSIRDVGESYSDNKKIKKNVRVVTNISFYLVD